MKGRWHPERSRTSPHIPVVPLRAEYSQPKIKTRFAKIGVTDAGKPVFVGILALQIEECESLL